MGWIASVTAVKISVLMFYWRIFAVKDFRHWILALGIYIVLTGIALVFAFIFQCTPVSYFWTGTSEGKCVDQLTFYLAAGSLNIVGDVLVIILPLRQVWKLNTSKGQRLALTCLFLLGGLYVHPP